MTNVKKSKIINITLTVLSRALLIIFALLILLPFWIILVNSVKAPAEIASATFTWWPTQGFDFTSYSAAFDLSLAKYTATIISGFKNTLLFTLPPVLIGVLASSLSAYAFSKINFKGKDILFTMVLLTMSIPVTIAFIPQYFLYGAIGWLNTPLPLLIPGMFGSAGVVFFLLQYMRGIPSELCEAAKVDGLGNIGVFFRIILPISMPALIAQFILTFISGYNDYMKPLLFLSGSPELYTMQLVLRNLSPGTNDTLIQSAMASGVIALVPLVLLYGIFNNFIVNNIAVSSVKG